MSLIELEFDTERFNRLLWFVVSAAPVPAPTLPLLAPGRLVSGLGWGPVALADGPPWLRVPGTVLATATLTVRHLSIAELAADRSAVPATAQATAWLRVTARPDGIAVALVALQPPGGVLLSNPPIPIGRRALPTGAEVPVAGAVLNQGAVVTVRLATDPGDNLLEPPANRLDHESGSWLLHISGGVFADRVRRSLAASLQSPPSGTELEENAQAAWGLVPGFPPTGEYGAIGHAGLKKPDACLTVFGYVDVSISVQAVLTIVPDPVPSTASMYLTVSGNASDWDSFRCWAGSAGLASVLVGVIGTPVAGVAAGLQSLLLLGSYVASQVGQGVAAIGPPVGFTKIDSGDEWVTYRATMALSRFGATVNAARVGHDGLVVVGDTPELLAATHDVAPAGPRTLGTSWYGHHDCRKGEWTETVEVEPVTVRDRVRVGDAVVRANTVTVFPTTRVEPANLWTVEVTPAAVDPVVRVRQAEGAAVPVGADGRLFLHTSAGLVRLDLAPVPAVPDRDRFLKAYQAVRCRQFRTEADPHKRIQWLVDPPPYDFGVRPVRQWLTTVPRLPAGVRLEFQPVRGDERVGEPVRVAADRDGTLVLEIVTDAETELDLSVESLPAGSRHTQRWLLPVHEIALPGRITAIGRSGEYVLAAVGERSYRVHRALGTVEELPPSPAVSDGPAARWTGPPQSRVVAANDMVAVARDDVLLLALPWATPAPRLRVGALR